MGIVDAHVHLFAAGGALHGTAPRFTGEQALAVMAEVGVEAAILVTPSIAGNDNGDVLEAARRYPDRFGVIGRIDAGAPDLDERLATWRRQPGMLGPRVTVRNAAESERWERGGFGPLFAAAECHELPVCINAPAKIADLARVAERHPGLSLVVDHLGLAPPPAVPLGLKTFAVLPAVMDLARFPNVSIKASGLSILSREPYPFEDLRELLLRALEAYGVERVMWGSDITRMPHPYAETAGWIAEVPGLSGADRAAILGANVRRILRWPAAADAEVRRPRGDSHIAVEPPSMTSSLPVTNDDSSDAR
jgi:L-fuconolactonase